MADYTSKKLPPLPGRPRPVTGDFIRLSTKRSLAMDQLRQAEQLEREARSARTRANRTTKNYLDDLEAVHGTLLDEL